MVLMRLSELINIEVYKLLLFGFLEYHTHPNLSSVKFLGLSQLLMYKLFEYAESCIKKTINAHYGNMHTVFKAALLLHVNCE